MILLLKGMPRGRVLYLVCCDVGVAAAGSYCVNMENVLTFERYSRMPYGVNVFWVLYLGALHFFGNG